MPQQKVFFVSKCDIKCHIIQLWSYRLEILSTFVATDDISYYYNKDLNTLFCLHWEMKGDVSLVNLVKRFSKIYTRPLRSPKHQYQFFLPLTSGIHLKIFATVFLCFITGKCRGSVKISYTLLYRNNYTNTKNLNKLTYYIHLSRYWIHINISEKAQHFHQNAIMKVLTVRIWHLMKVWLNPLPFGTFWWILRYIRDTYFKSLWVNIIISNNN